MSNYLNRKIDADLLAWSKAWNRKVLLLRGARQVGKTEAVRQLSKNFEHYLEINLDLQDEARSVFENAPSLDPQPIVEQLSLQYNVPIIAGKTLLFIDEIQASIRAISTLRYFYEKMPELHVVAAGSLLEFALEEIPSFGVGRITSMFMYPFSFEEFMLALGNKMQIEAYRKASPEKPLNDVIHNTIVNHLKRFLVVGGMPEAVVTYVTTKDLLQTQTVINSLIVSLKNDFAKYRKRVPLTRLNEVFESVARQAEGKFVYEKAAMQASNAQVKQALQMLVMAGLVIPVTHTAANGIPLGAEANSKFQRMFLLDTGILQQVLGLDMSQIFVTDDFKIVNRGAIAEIFVGLELLKSSNCYNPSSLYYWQRGKSEGDAQIDFLLQKSEKIIPIEVKAGTQGAMQSLRLFMKEKNIERGVRTSLENFGQLPGIAIYPMYAISNLI
ncbi:MAG: AAA family ATPase [Culturomica sp.]|jgi:predicted AAA+ superfamily ATPase|nr:AAA family ATPase [Culturomica sp.]